MTFIDPLIEALKPSQYRQYTKDWDKKTNLALFQDSKFETDKNKNRLYIPLEDSDGTPINPPSDIVMALRDVGYEISDYKKGLARSLKDSRRQMKIGKLLNKSPELQMKFAGDAQRGATKNEYEAVISRHPYDLAGMSTDRGWRSCMNIDDGEYSKYVAMDVKYGTIIAYAIKKGDRNIKDPVGRVLIKPFENEEDKSIIYGIENKVYGAEPDGFLFAVLNWVDEINDKLVKYNFKNKVVTGLRKSGLYSDTGGRAVSFKGDINDLSDKELYDVIDYQPLYYRQIEEPSPQITKLAVLRNGWNYKYVNFGEYEYDENAIKNLRKTAVRSKAKAVLLFNIGQEEDNWEEWFDYINENSEVMRYCPITDEEFIDWVINKSPAVIEYISNPSYDQIISVLEKYPSYVNRLKHQTDEYKIFAISIDPFVYEIFNNPSKDVKMALVDSDPNNLGLIENPSEDIIIAAYESAIKYENDEFLTGDHIDINRLPPNIIEEIIIRVPRKFKELNYQDDDSLQMLLVSEEPEYIKYIEHPTLDVQIAVANNHPKYLQNLLDIDEEAQKIMIRYGPEYIKYITYPTKEIQMEVIKHNPELIDTIQNLDRDVKVYYNKIMQSKQITEALRPNQYRKYVKGWDKSRYEDIFKNPKYRTDKNAYRIYIPIGKEKNLKSDVSNMISDMIREKGYKIDDYMKGIAAKIDEPKRQIKIGKLLKNDPEIAKKFTDDPIRRSSKSEYIAVISRHPYDIAGMSTGRSWTSCMNLDNLDSEGTYENIDISMFHDEMWEHFSGMGYDLVNGEWVDENDKPAEYTEDDYYNDYYDEYIERQYEEIPAHHVSKDVQYGTIIAYAVESDDTNIENPVARVLIKPFMNRNNYKESAFGVEDRIYGSAPAGFREIIINWANEVNKSRKLKGVYDFHGKLYHDSGPTFMRIMPDINWKEYPSEKIDKEILEQHKLEYNLFFDTMEDMKNNGKEPSDYLIKEMIELKKENIIFVKNPPEKLQLSLIDDNPQIIRHIRNPSEKAKRFAIKLYPKNIRFIQDQSEELQLWALECDPKSFMHVSKPTEKVQMAAIHYNPDFINFIYNPSEKIKLLHKNLTESQLNEALKPSQYRKYVKGWDKNRYSEYFENPKYEGDKNRYRIYLPLDNNISDGRNFPPDIVNALKNVGYEVSDYEKGLAQRIDNSNRKMKIGKLLAKHNPELSQVFASDPLRKAVKGEYEAVISRHPYDIAGMSTDRGWRSCMNIDDGIERKYVDKDVKHGTLIAYAIKKGDRNIEDPVGRLLIKPFSLKKDKSQVMLGIENTSYGEMPNGFRSTVVKWANAINEKKIKYSYGTTKEHPELYPDSLNNPIHFTGDINKLNKNKIKNIIIDNPFYFKDVKNPSFDIAREAIEQDGMNFKYIDKSLYSDNQLTILLHAAIENDPRAIRFAEIKNIKELQKWILKNKNIIPYLSTLSDNMKKWIVDNVPSAFHHIKGLSPQLMKRAIKFRPRSIEYLKNPSEELQLWAIRHNNNILDYINNPTTKVIYKSLSVDPHNISNLNGKYLTDEIILYAMKKDPSIFEYIYNNNLSKEVQLMAIKYDADWIHWIKNPDEDVQMAAVRKKIWAIDSIVDPTLKVITYVLKSGGIKYLEDMNEISDEIQLIACKANHNAIEYIKNQTEEAQWVVLKKDTSKIRYFDPDPTIKMMEYAIRDKKNFDNFYYIKSYYELDKKQEEYLTDIAVKVFPNNIRIARSSTEKQQLIAVKYDPLLLQHIRGKLSDKAIMAAVRRNPSAVKNIQTIPEKIQMYLVKKYPRNIQYIKRPLASVKAYAAKQIEKNQVEEATDRQLITRSF